MVMFGVKIADVIFSWNHEIWRHAGPKISYKLLLKFESNTTNVC